MEKKIITCASYGGTGSSAITDLLKEFNNINSLGDFEFAIAHEVDGISDLQHYIVDDNHRLKCDEGIYRFSKLVKRLTPEYSNYIKDFEKISNEYINSLVDIQWNGFWHQHLWRNNKFYRFLVYGLPGIIKWKFRKLFNSRSDYEYTPKHKRSKMVYSIPNDDFYCKTQKYTSDIINNIFEDKEYEYYALDQLVPVSNVKRYSRYFKNIKIIIVDRDPRDLYLLNKLYWNEGWIPTQNVETYVEWFNAIRSHTKFYDENTENSLRIQFEDLIYNYEDTIEKIIEFIGINKDTHIEKLKYFNPERSLKNTCLWKKNTIYNDEIEYIEKQLSEYCYRKK